jgi:hypothetical protein
VAVRLCLWGGRIDFQFVSSPKRIAMAAPSNLEKEQVFYSIQFYSILLQFFPLPLPHPAILMIEPMNQSMYQLLDIWDGREGDGI